ncbi:TPA: hypothetical protein ACH3X1_004446 [Trebouxia sp. C0004]
MHVMQANTPGETMFRSELQESISLGETLLHFLSLGLIRGQNDKAHTLTHSHMHLYVTVCVFGTKLMHFQYLCSLLIAAIILVGCVLVYMACWCEQPSEQ